MPKDSVIPSKALPDRHNGNWDKIAFTLSLLAAIVVLVNFYEGRRDRKLNRQLLAFNLAKMKAQASTDPELKKALIELGMDV